MWHDLRFFARLDPNLFANAFRFEGLGFSSEAHVQRWGRFRELNLRNLLHPVMVTFRWMQMQQNSQIPNGESEVIGISCALRVCFHTLEPPEWNVALSSRCFFSLVPQPIDISWLDTMNIIMYCKYRMLVIFLPQWNVTASIVLWNIYSNFWAPCEAKYTRECLSKHVPTFEKFWQVDDLVLFHFFDGSALSSLARQGSKDQHWAILDSFSVYSCSRSREARI